MVNKMKKRVKAIEIIINDFLEANLTIEDLKNNTSLKEALKDIFEGEALFDNGESNVINKLFDLNYPAKGGKYKWIMDKPLFRDDWPKKKKQTFEEKLIKSKEQMHQIWLKILNAAEEKRREPPPYIRHRNNLCEFQVDLIYSHDTIQFGANEIVLKFIILLNGLPFNLFRLCLDDKCNRGFVSSRSKKKFCSTRCSNRTRQKRLHSKNPEEYNEKQRKYYEKKCDERREREGG